MPGSRGIQECSIGVNQMGINPGDQDSNFRRDKLLRDSFHLAKSRWANLPIFMWWKVAGTGEIIEMHKLAWTPLLSKKIF